uniref:Uncharacterized protein n=1 Tax=Anguilla anguilla TaxID=7936 RepID=A0A0E9RDH9_ANGAN
MYVCQFSDKYAYIGMTGMSSLLVMPWRVAWPIQHQEFGSFQGFLLFLQPIYSCIRITV